MEILYALSVLASGLAAILAWIAKIRWSKEFADAKEATIAARDSLIEAKEAEIAALKNHIEGLRDLTPMKIREYFTSVKTQLEEYNAELQNQLVHAKSDIEAKDAKIVELGRLGEAQADAVIQLRTERDALLQNARELEAEISGVSQRALLHGILAPLQRMELAIHLADRSIQSGQQEEAFQRLAAVRAEIPEVKRCVQTFLTTEPRGRQAATANIDRTSVPLVATENRVLEIVHDFRARAERVRKTLVSQIRSAPKLPMADFDFELILANLIDNAIKYGIDGTRVEVCCVQDGKEFMLDVVSHGIPVERAEADRIFEPGYRTVRAARMHLTAAGLGLFAARQAAQRWGGKLYLHASEPDGNQSCPDMYRNTFRFVIPIRRDDDPDRR